MDALLFGGVHASFLQLIFKCSSSVWLTTELAVLESASPSGRNTAPGQPNARITSSCEMVTERTASR